MLFSTAQLEKYKSEKSALAAELSELRAAHTELEQRANADSEKYAEMKKKLSYCEVKAAEYRSLHDFHSSPSSYFSNSEISVVKCKILIG